MRNEHQDTRENSKTNAFFSAFLSHQVKDNDVLVIKFEQRNTDWPYPVDQ